MKLYTQIKLFLLFLMFVGVNSLFAQVNITQATGGQNISVHKAVGGSSEGYTSIGTFTIEDQAAGQFAAGVDRKIYLVPSQAHWQINPSAGTLNFGGTNITAASMLVESDKITITYTVIGTTADDNFISVSGIEVQSATTAKEAAASLRRSTAGALGGNNGTISGFGNNAVVAPLSEVEGSYAQLLVLLPGETQAPGTLTGKTGTPIDRPAGAAFNTTVRAVDVYWNTIATNNDLIQITSSDANASYSANNTLASGTRNFSVWLRTIGNATVTATNLTQGGFAQSSSVDVVVGAYSRLVVILPGEVEAPGNPNGKTGTPDAQTAGTPFSVKVLAVDAAGNLVNTINNEISFTATNDANAQLPANANLVNGELTTTATYLTAGTNRRITATDATANETGYSAFTVSAGVFTKLLLLLPGETAAPGTPTGKTGTPTDRTAGAQFAVTVRAVDAYWNLVNTITDQINVTSDDAEATHPANNTLSAGARNFNITLRTIGTTTITVTDVTDGSKTLASGSVNVVSGGFARLQILLPGETAAPGTPTGKTGTPTGQTAGTPFTVTVNAVDAAWNPVAGITDVVHLSTTDANATMPSDLAMVNGVATFSSVTLVTGGNRTITATNITDGTKTANTSPNVAVSAGAFVKLQLLLPGETAAPGTPTGKTGTPTDRTAGVQFAVTVNAVDANWNRVLGITDQINISSDDAEATHPANNTLNNGTRNFNIILRTVGTVNITATDITDGSKTLSTGSVNVVSGGFARLQILLPGETAAPGTPTGKTGTPVGQVAGTPFTVTVNAVDAAWNPVAGITDVVHLSTTDANATMPSDLAMVNGVAAFSSVTLVTGGNRTITATNVTDGTKTANTSPNVAVSAGAFVKLLLLLPGETAAPGTPTGKTGTPTDRTAGTAFNVTVRAVDAYWNLVNTITDQVNVTSDDAGATHPANNTLSAGTRNFSITLRTVGTVNITATDITDGSKTLASGSVNVISGGFARLQILLPGETAAPGTPTGKTGTPVGQVAGTPFTVTVSAVDAAWNPVAGITDVVHLSTTDANATMPSDLAMVNGVATFSSVTLVTGGNRTITATNVTDGTKTANTSPNVAIGVGPFTKLLVILPGETAAPGTPTGKTGTPTDRTAGTAFNITVRAVDAYWNTVTTVTDAIHLTTTDINGTVATNDLALVNGTRNFSVTLRTVGVGVSTITATDIADINITDYTTNPITVVVGAYTRLVVILPGETAAPGIAAGKTGTPTDQVAGVPFSVKVIAVDAAGNVVASVNNEISFTATNDTYAQLPATANLVNGELNTTATYRTAGTNRRLTATDAMANRTGYSAFDLSIGDFAKLLIILPGETYTAGHPDGKTGIPSNQATNTAFNITVRAVDATFNTITTITDVVGITSNDGLAVLPANAALVNGVKTDFSVTLNTISYNPETTTLTATNITDGAIAPYTTDGIVVLLPSATSDYFRSAVASGNWNNSSSWESSPDAILWQPSTLVPATASKGITIQNGHTITITGTNATVGNAGAILIENGAQVTLTSGRILTINNGAATNDLVVEGTLRSSGTITISSGAALQFAATGKYQHNFTTTTGTIPTADWVTGSTCEVIGYTTFAGDVTGSNQIFSDFVWNAPSQTGAGSPSLLSGFGTTNLAVISTGAGTLNLASVGGTLTITGNYTQATGRVNVNKTSGIQNLNIAGNFLVNGGVFTLGNGTVNVRFNGSTQSLVNAGPIIEFQDVRFISGGTKTLTSGSFSVATTGALTMGINTTLNANGNLTMLSSALSSGRISPIPSSSAITGNVNVQRSITGGTQDPYRTYRMFSSPVHTGSNAYAFSQFIDDMIITGAGGSANGFDQTSVNPASAYTYVWGSGFVPIPNINTTLQAGQGAYIFFRGDRSNISGKTVSPFVDPESVIMDFEGVLNQQDVTVSLDNGTLVGNPYASSIDWNSAGITKNNLANNVIQIWNPQERKYATYDGDLLEGLNGGSNIIPVGQGFFVRANGSGSLTFAESAKVTDQPSLLLMSAPTEENLVSQKFGEASGKIMAATSVVPTSAPPRAVLRLTLSANGSVYNEETAIVFQEGKNAAYGVAEDTRYLSGGSEQKVFLSSLSNDNTNLVINYMPEISASSSVKLNISSNNASGDYQLKLKYKDLPTDYSVRINDSYLGTSTLVQNGDSYSFSIDKTQSASFGVNRLSVSFEPSTTLPVDYASFTVAKINQGVAVKWSTLTEADNNRFEIERAGDDQNFVRIHTEQAKGSNSNYSYIDKNPLLGNNYYRLVQFDNSGKAKPTKPQVINYTDEVSGTTDIVSIYPNPVVTNFTVKYNGALKANQQTLKVINTTGQVMLTQSIAKAELLAGYEINISNYASGVYVVEVYENGTRVSQTKLVKQ